MKTNKYADLIKFGISHKTLMTISESNLNTLHKNLIEGKKEVCPVCGMKDCECNHSKKKETKESQDITTKIRRFSSSEVNTAKQKGESLPGGRAMKLNPDGSVDVTLEGEMSEAKKKSKKEKGLNPWAICTKQLGGQFKTTERSEWSPKQMAKYERCVKAVKQSISEGKDPFEVILENKILSLVEKHIKPKMKKGDLMDLIGKKTMKKPITTLGSIDVTEDTKTAPTKPTTKPGTKTPPKPDKDSPYKPKTSPAPKAVKKETKEGMVANAPAPTKPTTKPGTKTPPKPDKDSPYKPKTSPAPKAKKSMPDWMSFENIGIKLKK